MKFLFPFMFLFSITLFSQENCINVLFVVDGKISFNNFSGQLEYKVNDNVNLTKFSYFLGCMRIEDTISKSLSDTSTVFLTLNYYYLKHFKNYSYPIEQQYTIPFRAATLFNCGYLVIAIRTNKDKTYEIALTSDRFTSMNWHSRKMKKNRKIFYNFH